MRLPFKMLLAAAMIILGWSAPTVNAAPAGYYSDQKVVYHNDGGTPDNAAYFKRMLTSINNHIEAVGKDHVQIRVVDHGGGLEMFQMAQSDKTLAAQLNMLREKGARFLICANTLKERN